MKKLMFAAVAIATLSAPLSAQIAPTNTGSGGYWDNESTDGEFCNAGYVLTGVAGDGNTCINQVPANWLPYDGPAPTGYWNDGFGGFNPFFFGAGSYSFSLLNGNAADGGDVTGAPDAGWGYFTVNGGGGFDYTDLSTTLPAGYTTFATGFGLWIDLYTGGRALSTLDSQFAAFFLPGGTSVIASFEDSQGLGSDWDYNDEFVQIAWEDGGGPNDIVPEPATMTLLATGLAGMAAAGRRRKKNKQ